MALFLFLTMCDEFLYSFSLSTGAGFYNLSLYPQKYVSPEPIVTLPISYFLGLSYQFILTSQ